MTEQNRRIVLASRPVGEPKPTDFRLESAPVPEPGPGQVLLRTLWLSLDPYMRGRMSDAKSYAKPVGIGEVMTGGTVGEVVRSNDPKFAPGDLALGMGGWQEYAVLDGKELRKVDPAAAPLSTALGVLGMPGMTAYTGLLNIGQPKSGRDRRGRRGDRAGRLARRPDREDQRLPRGRHRRRRRQVPGADRGARLRRRRRPPRAGFPGEAQGRLPEGHRRLFRERRRRGVGRGVPAPQRLRAHAGVRAHRQLQHDRAAAGPGPHGRDLPRRPDEAPHHPRLHRLGLPGAGAGVRDARSAQWLREGRIKYREDVVEGLDNAPQAFMGLLKGKNFGKLVVRVAK